MNIPLPNDIVPGTHYVVMIVNVETLAELILSVAAREGLPGIRNLGTKCVVSFEVDAGGAIKTFKAGEWNDAPSHD